MVGGGILMLALLTAAVQGARPRVSGIALLLLLAALSCASPPPPVTWGTVALTEGNVLTVNASAQEGLIPALFNDERRLHLTIAVLGENGETILELVSIALLLLRDCEGDTFLVGHERG